MTNQEFYELSKNSEFRKVVEAGIALSANAIVGENNAGILTDAWKTKRHNLSVKVLNNTQGNAVVFALPLAALPQVNDFVSIDPETKALTPTGAELDTIINVAVSAEWDNIAGVSYDEKQAT